MRQPQLMISGPAPAPTATDLAALDPLERGEWWWRQPRRGVRRWELVAGERTVAALERTAGLWRGTTIRFADGTLRIPPAPFGCPRALRQDPARTGAPGGSEGAAPPAARFVPSFFGGGRIETDAGEPVEWRRTGWFRRGFLIRTPDQLPLVHAALHFSLLKLEGSLALEDAARARSDLATLLAFGWYVALHQRRHGY